MDSERINCLFAFDKCLGIETFPAKFIEEIRQDFVESKLRNSDVKLDKKKLLDNFAKRYRTREVIHKDVSGLDIFGEGSCDATVMFVGGFPDVGDELEGRPFVSESGKKLNQMINAMKLKREEVWITNLFKYRISSERIPLEDEVNQAKSWLLEEISIINPKIIVSLGQLSASALLSTSKNIEFLRGKLETVSIKNKSWLVMPTFHPAYVLKQYTPEVRNKVWFDLQLVMQSLSN